MRRASPIILATAAIMAAAASFFFLPPSDPPDRVVRAEIAGVKLSFARAYARDGATAAGGVSDRLIFIASFPEFSPVSETDRGGSQVVTLTLTPRDEGLDPQERPSKLYARFLTPETFTGPGGLVLRRFEAGSPYQSEELFIAPPDGRAFFARCPAPQTGTLGESCLSVFRMGPIDVELRYPASLLEQWDTLDEGRRSLLSQMRAASGRPLTR